jgi:hypothetical protein
MGLNLLPSVAKFQVAKVKIKKRILIFIVAVSVIWFVITTSVFGVWIWQNSQLAVVKKNYEKIYSEYKKKADLLVTSQKLKYQAKTVGEVLATRFEYGVAITNINKLMPEGVSITNFSVKSKNEFEINYETMDGKLVDAVEAKMDEINKGKIEGFVGAELTSIEDRTNVWILKLNIKTK